MYKSIIRPILFLFSPETIHHFVAGGLKFVGKIPGGRALVRAMFGYKGEDLERNVFGITFPNPIGMAAGFDKDASFYRELSGLGFGFVEVGTVTPLPQTGHQKPRLFRLKRDRALVNRMGFNNLGVESMIRSLRKRKPGTIIGVNLGKNTLTKNEDAPADYLKMFRVLYEYADYFVVNISCPNVKDMTALQNRESIVELLEGLFDFRRGQDRYRPILLKISPDLSFAQIDDIIEILVSSPLDGLVAVNTTTSRESLSSSNSLIKRVGDGGLSGAPLTERAIEIVKYIHQKSEGSYPIIGVGGVMSPEDAQRMLDAGASLVQVYSGFIYEGPSFVKRICKHIASTPSL